MIRNSERHSFYNEVLQKNVIHAILLSQPWTHKKLLGFDRVINVTSKNFSNQNIHRKKYLSKGIKAKFTD